MTFRNFATRSIELPNRVANSTVGKARNGLPTKGSSLSRIPTKDLIRSLVLMSMMSKTWLMKPCLTFLDAVTRSKSGIINADRNPILNRVLRWTIYNQFCAGSNSVEVSRSMGGLRQLGYKGVILGFAKEIVLDPSEGATVAEDVKYGPACYRMIDEWKNANLDTIRMLSPGDFLSVKLTGAGPICIAALQARERMPPAISEALDEISIETRKAGARLWIDAEQQILQIGLDEWVIELMKRHNQKGEPLVYNTIQAYLKGARENAQRHILQAAQEGWSLGVKLVRGAYIENEVRSLIHDTKSDSDQSYDDIADMLISRRVPQTDSREELSFPTTALMLATHNAASASKAMATHRDRAAQRLPLTKLECGQIKGMADELSCSLIEDCEGTFTTDEKRRIEAPGVFKYVAWGSVSECMGYLYRRAVENRGAVERTQHMVDALAKELRRRVFG